MNVGKAITRAMQDQKYKDEGRLIYWKLAYTQERLMRVLIKLNRYEASL